MCFPHPEEAFLAQPIGVRLYVISRAEAIVGRKDDDNYRGPQLSGGPRRFEWARGQRDRQSGQLTDCQSGHCRTSS